MNHTEKQNNKSSLSPLQQVMLEMMKWFHETCTAHGISYYMVGGTMLGAARHEGFIPWDDDIDVGLPRRDYQRFLALGKRLPEDCRYRIESFHNGNADFEYTFAKVYDTQTTLIENKRKHPRRGVYIDVVPLDGIGNSAVEALRNYRPILRQTNLLNLKICDVRKGRTWYKNAAIRLMGLLPEPMLGVRRQLCRIEKMCTQRGFDAYTYGGNLVGAWGEKEIVPRRFFGTPTLYPFEDASFYGVEDYDAYLTCMYGNWRQLPPVSKQVTHHDFCEVDLERAYLNKGD